MQLPELHPLEKGTGLLVKAGPAQTLGDLPAEFVETQFREAGLLLFRGFQASEIEFHRFVSRFSTRFIREPNRIDAGVGGGIQHVNAGMQAVEIHAENGNTPFRPDSIWFCCVHPASHGGESLFCDGVALWNGLDAATQQLFRDQPLTYTTTIPAAEWRAFLGPGASIASVLRLAGSLPGVKLSVNNDLSLDSAYTVSAIVQSRFSQEASFANSILGPYDHTISFAGGGPIPQEVMQEIKEKSSQLSLAVVLEKGDVVMIDNSRFLHGRNALEDPERKILSALTNLNFK